MSPYVMNALIGAAGSLIVVGLYWIVNHKTSTADVANDYAEVARTAWDRLDHLETEIVRLRNELSERDQTIARQARKIDEQAQRIFALEARSMAAKTVLEGQTIT